VVQRGLAFPGGQLRSSYAAAAAAFVGPGKSRGILAGKMSQNSGHRSGGLREYGKILEPRWEVPVQQQSCLFPGGS
jgi:hypothetical protein